MFSVIMPVYNHAAYVGQAIESVHRQSFADWELVIVDDGSTDGSGRIAKAWAARDGRIRVIHQANAGPAAARNRGIAESAGPWLAFLDSDDVYLPSALADFHQFIAAHPQTRFVYGWRHRLGADGKVTEVAGEYQDRPTGPAELFQRMYLSHPSLCYRRDLLEQVGGYDARLRSLEDYDLYLRMSLLAPFDPLGKATALRRRHQTNISRQSGFSRMLEGAVLRRFLEQLGDRRVLEPHLVKRRLGKVYYAAGREHFKSGCFADAAAALGISLGYRRTAKAAVLKTLCTLLATWGRRDDRQVPSLD
jgi:glycosyltransferase involved in cell wall biosynthesis